MYMTDGPQRESVQKGWVLPLFQILGKGERRMWCGKQGPGIELNHLQVSDVPRTEPRASEARGADHHGDTAEGIAGTLEVMPLYPIQLAQLLCRRVINSVQIGRPTSIKPPASCQHLGTLADAVVMVQVLGTETGSM